MTKSKNKFIFVGLSISAYLSPILMLISIMSNKWLYSVEKVSNGNTMSDRTYVPNIGEKNTTLSKSDGSLTSFLPLEFIEASYGLWEMCRISGNFILLIIFLKGIPITNNVVFSHLSKYFIRKLNCVFKAPYKTKTWFHCLGSSLLFFSGILLIAY